MGAGQQHLERLCAAHTPQGRGGRVQGRAGKHRRHDRAPEGLSSTGACWAANHLSAAAWHGMRAWSSSRKRRRFFWMLAWLDTCWMVVCQHPCLPLHFPCAHQQQAPRRRCITAGAPSPPPGTALLTARVVPSAQNTLSAPSNASLPSSSSLSISTTTCCSLNKDRGTGWGRR